MSVAWVTVDEDDLMTSMTARERDLFGTSVVVDAAGDPSGPTDRVTQILSDVVAEVRMQIASWQGNTLDSDATKIPEGCRANTLAIARYRLLITVPRYEPGEGRREEYRSAMKFFEKVAEGKIKPLPSSSAEANPTPPAHSAEVLSTVPDSRTGRTKMDGL